MPTSYHRHMAAAIETEPEFDLLMANSGEALPLLFDAGHMAFAGGDVLRVIDKLDRTREIFLDAVVKGAFTAPGDGSLDFAAIIGRLARLSLAAGDRKATLMTSKAPGRRRVWGTQKEQ